MFTTRQTKDFAEWLAGLADERAAKRIAARIVRVEAGLLGDVRSVGGKVSELRVDYGPGYRVYFTRRDGMIILLLCGGDKSTQPADILRAQAMVEEMERPRKARKKRK